ncbi:MAG: PilZ domain-containing protein [Planctomycetes bacterium]|nr:PilZ domain-containing protein [Planctomycetota bacterium]
MADDPIRITDGESHCRIPDGKGGSSSVPIVEISPAGALLRSSATFELNAYLDLSVALKGQPQRNFFAHVRECGENGLRIQWMHIDPGEQRRLRELLDAYRAATRAGAAAGGEGDKPRTRRVVKPGAFSAGEITPFSDSTPSGGQSALEPAGSDRVGTRRVLRPSGRHEPRPETPPAKDPLDDSRAHQVVVATTDRFNRLADEEQPQVVVPAKAAALAHADKPAATPSEEAGTPEPAATPDQAAAPNKPMVVGADGRMDIGASIRSKAKTVRASELAARHERVRVLNLATIKALIQQAVEEAASHLSRALGEAERKRLLEEAEESFQEKLKEFQAQKIDAEVRSRQLQEQLDSAKRLLEDERKRQIAAEQFTVSAKGLEDIEGVFRRLIDRSATEGKLEPGLEEQLRKVATHVLDDERQRIREKEMQAQNEKIELLEKKIRRLATNLEETERQRDEARDIAQHLEKFAGQGLSVEQIKNKYQAGLRGDDPNRERKLAIMKELIEENRELRRALGLPMNAPAEIGAQAAAPAAAPAQPVEQEPEPLSAGDAAGEDASAAATDEDVVAEVNPDDLPWEAPAAVPVSDSPSAIKRIAVKAGQPPPAAPEEPVAEEVNPDDLPWEPPTTGPAGADDSPSGVKRMAVVRKEPPPLSR